MAIAKRQRQNNQLFPCHVTENDSKLVRISVYLQTNYEFWPFLGKIDLKCAARWKYSRRKTQNIRQQTDITMI